MQLSFLVLIGVFQLIADNSGIQPLTRSDLTPSQIKVLDQIRDLPTTEGEPQIVRINPSTLREHRHFVVPLPGSSSVTVDITTLKTTNERAFSITGRVPEGTATIAVNEDSVNGSIHTNSTLYRIRPLGGGVHAVIKVGEFPEEHPQ